MENKQISAGLEDYLETIYVAKKDNEVVKGVQLAKMLKISRASVSEALSKLVNKGLVEYQSFGAIDLTTEGLEEALKVYSKHNILKNFFEKVLNIPPEEAGINACKIEHIISYNILNEIKEFTLYCSKNPEIIDRYRQRKQNEINLSNREISGSTDINGKNQ